MFKLNAVNATDFLKDMSEKLISFFRQEAVVLSIIFLVALSLRLLHIHSIVDIPPFSDALEYHEFAADMVNRHVFGDTWTETYRGPIYSFFLSVVYFFYGINYTFGRIAQAVVSSATCILIYFLAKKVFSQATGYVAAAISAFFSLYIFYSGLLLTETLYTFLSVLLVLSIYRIFEQPTNRNIILSGLLLGFIALTRVEILFTYIFIVPVFFFYNRFKFQKTIRQLAIILTACLVVIIPWTVRNYHVTKSFVLISSQGGENFWMGNHVGATGWHTGVPEEMFKNYESQQKMDKDLYKLGFDFIKNNPKEWLSLAKIKIGSYFNYWTDDALWEFTDRFSFAGNLSPPLVTLHILSMLCIAGMVLSIKYIRRSLLFYPFFVSNLLLQIILYVEPRFRMQISPFMVIFAASPVFLLENTILKKLFPFSFIPPEPYPPYPEKIKKQQRRPHNLQRTLTIAAICTILLILSAMPKRIIDYRNYLDSLNDVIIIEGEKPKDSNYYSSPGFVANSIKLLGGKSLELQAPDAAKENYYVTYDFELADDGMYNIFIAGTPPGPAKKGEEWFSPYTISIDNTVTKSLTEELLSEEWPSFYDFHYHGGAYYFIRLMTVPLKQGSHEIKITIDGRRKHDGNFTFFIDALVIVPEDFKPKSDVKNMPKDLFYRTGKQPTEEELIEKQPTEEQ